MWNLEEGQEVSTVHKYSGILCPTCHVSFAVPTGWRRHFIDTKRQLYCPVGHSLSYTESALDTMRRERDRLKQQMAEKEDELREAVTSIKRRNEMIARGEKERKRIMRRVHAGVCPDCNRTFVNVARHMATKHDAKPTLAVTSLPAKRKSAPVMRENA